MYRFDCVVGTLVISMNTAATHPQNRAQEKKDFDTKFSPKRVLPLRRNRPIW